MRLGDKLQYKFFFCFRGLKILEEVIDEMSSKATSFCKTKPNRLGSAGSQGIANERSVAAHLRGMRPTPYRKKDTLMLREKLKLKL